MEYTDIQKKAIQEFNNSGDDGKRSLIAVFGNDLFKQDLTERIKTFSEVCEEAGVNEADFKVPESGTAEEMAAAYLKRLKLICKVFNAGWRPDTADTSQYKYYPWFQVNPDKNKLSSFSLSFNGYDFGNAATYLGVRLYYRDSKTAIYVGKQFLAEYELYFQYLNQCD